MVELVSSRLRFDKEPNRSQQRSTYADWWQQRWHAFMEWLTEPISFPGQWPTCNPSEERYNRDKEGMILSPKKSLADVQ
jgi:hypothetical protein